MSVPCLCSIDFEEHKKITSDDLQYLFLNHKARLFILKIITLRHISVLECLKGYLEFKINISKSHARTTSEVKLRLSLFQNDTLKALAPNPYS